MVNIMDACKIISFFIAIGWHIVKNGFATFLEDRSTGAVEYSETGSQMSTVIQMWPLAQEVPEPLI